MTPATEPVDPETTGHGHEQCESSTRDGSRCRRRWNSLRAAHRSHLPHLCGDGPGPDRRRIV
jgi:hypothetical protein